MTKPNFLTQHLKETGENYFEHFLFAFTTSMWLGLCCLILLCHAIFPFVFTVTTSKHVTKINHVMQQRVAALMARRSKAAASAPESQIS
jgi:hypothetical protein